MTQLTDFLRRLRATTPAERPDLFFMEAIEQGGRFEPRATPVEIDLHGIHAIASRLDDAICDWTTAAGRKAEAETKRRAA